VSKKILPPLHALAQLASRLPFEPAAFGHPFALVGGSVRDAVLERVRTPLDFDLVTPGPALAQAKTLAKRLGVGYAVLDAHYEIARIVFPDGTTVDVARQQGKELIDDLARRDYAINAMAYDPAAGMLIDPFGGADDLAAGRLRMVSEANLAEDPLRLLRAYRQAAQLDFAIEPATRATIVRLAPLLAQVSAERVRDELIYLLKSAHGADWLLAAHRDGLLAPWLPELAAMESIGPTGLHHLPLVEHTFEVIRQVDTVATELAPLLGDALVRVPGGGRSVEVLVKLAALLHDVAKPETRRLDPQTGRLIGFPGHELRGAEIAEAVMERLKFSREEGRWVVALVRHHLRPGFLAANFPPGDRALYRLFRDLGPMLPALAVLALADRRATRGPQVPPEAFERAEALSRLLLERWGRPDDPMAHLRPLVDGNLLMRTLDLAPGPQVGRLLALLHEAQAVGEVTTREDALALARRLVSLPEKVEEENDAGGAYSSLR